VKVKTRSNSGSGGGSGSSNKKGSWLGNEWHVALGVVATVVGLIWLLAVYYFPLPTVTTTTTTSTTTTTPDDTSISSRSRGAGGGRELLPPLPPLPSARAVEHDRYPQQIPLH